MILNDTNKKKAKDIFSKIIDLGVNFKLQKNVTKKHLTKKDIETILVDLSEKGIPVEKVIKEFKKNILPFCTNFSSKNFLGFPDAGNSVGAISGGILHNFLQQNLINQSFCAPSATFIEIAVIQWLREAVGYKKTKPKDIWSVGGIITPGGTTSNSVGMMLARENKVPGTLQKGVTKPNLFKIIVPKGIGHYSVKSAQMWVGCGNNLLEVETKDFRYDLKELKKTLINNKGKVMALVAYVGDSRTMTVDNLNAIADLTHKIDPQIWLHADACHGFSLGFSKELRYKIKGLEKFDSISADPHKVMLTPYTLSALLIKDPENMKKVISVSDLIIQEQFAFGQVTPFIGSKPWISLKLWFMMKTFGKKGLDDLITKRHKLTLYLSSKLKEDNNFIILNKVEINSVAFFYIGQKNIKVDAINRINKEIHKMILHEGKYHLHQFSILDSGLFKKNKLIYPLRFMCGNPNVTTKDIDKMIQYVKLLGKKIEENDR
ncbi:MAG: pyridoxal-dependent decarboxylase [Patescibacteria group bacterium]